MLQVQEHTLTWGTGDKGWKIVSASGNDGTNPDVY